MGQSPDAVGVNAPAPAKLDRKDALKLAAKERGLTRRAAYNEMLTQHPGQPHPED